MENENENDTNKDNIAIEVITQEVINRLRMFGLGDVVATRVIGKFGLTTALDRVKENPYDLMLIPGISFKRADNIALNTGIEKDDPRRQRALIMHILQDATNAGHVFLPARELEKKAKREEIDLVGSDIIETLVASEVLVVEGAWPIEPFVGCDIYLTTLHQAEESVAKDLKERREVRDTVTFGAFGPGGAFSAIVEARSEERAEEVEAEAEKVKEKEKEKADMISWDVDQLNFLHSFHKSSVVVLTGGPGTGKTTLTKAVCSAIEERGMNFALCAPTGKAAKRCSELTGHSASTIHRLLRGSSFGGGGSKPGFWGHNHDNQLTGYDYLIVDESSMLDIELVYHLLDAIPKSTKIIFIGDVDQLQPVGPGSFFKDLIRSETVPVFRLQTNHRQGKGSLIADNALAINKGKLQFKFNNDDFFYIEAESAPVIREKLMHILKTLYNDLDYKDLVRDVQVLTPQKRTSIGTEKLNELLRFRINTNANPDEPFSVGDKVMQIKNDYDLKLFNGFVGQVRAVHSGHYEIDFFDMIDYESGPDAKNVDKVIKYPKTMKRNLMHAYACTVHKYQGSEIKVGIIVISSVHTWMLTRNLIYTAITRCKEICILVGDKMGLKKAIKNNREQARFSKLLVKLTDGNKTEAEALAENIKKGLSS